MGPFRLLVPTYRAQVEGPVRKGVRAMLRPALHQNPPSMLAFVQTADSAPKVGYAIEMPEPE